MAYAKLYENGDRQSPDYATKMQRLKELAGGFGAGVVKGYAALGASALLYNMYQGVPVEEAMKNVASQKDAAVAVAVAATTLLTASEIYQEKIGKSLVFAYNNVKDKTKNNQVLKNKITPFLKNMLKSLKNKDNKQEKEQGNNLLSRFKQKFGR